MRLKIWPLVYCNVAGILLRFFSSNRKGKESSSNNDMAMWESFWIRKASMPIFYYRNYSILAFFQPKQHQYANFTNKKDRFSFSFSIGIGIGIDMSGDGGVRRLCKEGRLQEVLHLMDKHSIRSNSSSASVYACILQACLGNAADAKVVHAHIIQTGFKPTIYLQTKLVTVYAKCQSITNARRVLDEMPKRDVVSWTAMITAYSKQGQYHQILELFHQMLQTDVQPDHFTFAIVISACANLEALEHGRFIHENVIRSGFQFDVFVGSALVDMYVKCANVEDARKVFDKMADRDVVSWTSIVAGYAQNGHLDEAVKLFRKMPERNVVSWNAMTAGYAQNGHVDKAFELFQQMPERDVVSWNAMVAGYAKEGRFDQAMKLFHEMPERNVVSWNAIIAGFAQNGNFQEALRFFNEMQSTNVRPNFITFASILQACANLATLETGKQIHARIIRSGVQPDVVVENALVDMYAKCGHLVEARSLFDKMTRRKMVIDLQYGQSGHLDEAVEIFQKTPEQKVVLWCTMIAGYVQSGHFNEALELFLQMQVSGVMPNSVTFTSILPACANLAALEHGKQLHANIIKSGFQSKIFVGNALVDMYAKCGSIKNALKVFSKMPERDAVSWNSMIAGHAMHGNGTEALLLFEQMEQSGTMPDTVTFIGVLSACCYAGLVADGLRFFDCMSQDYHITPTEEHYCCIVDLLGRVGHLDQAYNFIKRMPIKPTASVWRSLLGACRIHSNIELGHRAAECLLESNPEDDAHYVLLSNIYAAAGKWNDVEKVRKMMKERRIKRNPGCSWIEVNNKVYPFFTEDRSHPTGEY